jgi:hypothetical protein
MAQTPFRLQSFSLAWLAPAQYASQPALSLDYPTSSQLDFDGSMRASTLGSL